MQGRKITEQKIEENWTLKNIFYWKTYVPSKVCTMYNGKFSLLLHKREWKVFRNTYGVYEERGKVYASIT